MTHKSARLANGGFNMNTQRMKRITGWLRAIERNPAVAKRLFRTRAEIDAEGTGR